MEQVPWSSGKILKLYDAALIRVALRLVQFLYLNTIAIRKTTPDGVVFFLVDDIGLEPMTFRTSSGCSSQLS